MRTRQQWITRAARRGQPGRITRSTQRRVSGATHRMREPDGVAVNPRDVLGLLRHLPWRQHRSQLKTVVRELTTVRADHSHGEPPMSVARPTSTAPMMGRWFGKSAAWQGTSGSGLTSQPTRSKAGSPRWRRRPGQRCERNRRRPLKPLQALAGPRRRPHRGRTSGRAGGHLTPPPVQGLALHLSVQILKEQGLGRRAGGSDLCKFRVVLEI